MIDVKILEDDDIIAPTDWCRPLSIVSMSGGMSDSYSFKCCYTGKPENNVEWCRAGITFGKCWFEKPTTLKELRKIMDSRYEFVRGDVPKKHQINMKNYSSRKY